MILDNNHENISENWNYEIENIYYQNYINIKVIVDILVEILLEYDVLNSRLIKMPSFN